MLQQSVKEHFRDILIGFEEFSFTEAQIKERLPDFELALRDYKCCLYCKVGRSEKERCRTSVGSMSHKGYFGLYKRGCTMYKRPDFAVYECPGPVVRRELIAQTKLTRREEMLFAGSTHKDQEAYSHHSDR